MWAFSLGEAPWCSSDSDSNATPSFYTKLSLIVAQPLIHYATSNITPQQTLSELSITVKVLDAKSPYNFLVFDLGYDSLFRAMLNYGWRTIFLEEYGHWIIHIARKNPEMKAHHVRCSTIVAQSHLQVCRSIVTYLCRSVGKKSNIKSDMRLFVRYMKMCLCFLICVIYMHKGIKFKFQIMVYSLHRPQVSPQFRVVCKFTSSVGSHICKREVEIRYVIV